MAANRRSFIIRIWQNEDGSVTGQISNPQNDWRRPFQDAAELWHLLIADAATLSPSDELSQTRSPTPIGLEPAGSKQTDSKQTDSDKEEQR